MCRNHARVNSRTFQEPWVIWCTCVVSARGSSQASGLFNVLCYLLTDFLTVTSRTGEPMTRWDKETDVNQSYRWPNDNQWQGETKTKEWHGSGIGGITAVSTVLPREWVQFVRYYRGIGAEIRGIPVGMGASPAVLLRLWGWVFSRIWKLVEVTCKAAVCTLTASRWAFFGLLQNTNN